MSDCQFHKQMVELMWMLQNSACTFIKCACVIYTSYPGILGALPHKQASCRFAFRYTCILSIKHVQTFTSIQYNVHSSVKRKNCKEQNNKTVLITIKDVQKDISVLTVKIRHWINALDQHRVAQKLDC